MSTRCVINFTSGKEIEAKVYRHSDGYPDGPHGVPADLKRFFAAVEKDTADTRYSDPNYLAAKFVVWQAGECARSYDGKTGRWKKAKRLNFLGVGVCMTDPGDIEWVYTVDCTVSRDVLTPAGLTAKGRPSVTWKEAHS